MKTYQPPGRSGRPTTWRDANGVPVHVGDLLFGVQDSKMHIFEFVAVDAEGQAFIRRHVKPKVASSEMRLRLYERASQTTVGGNGDDSRDGHVTSAKPTPAAKTPTLAAGKTLPKHEPYPESLRKWPKGRICPRCKPPQWHPPEEMHPVTCYCIDCTREYWKARRKPKVQPATSVSTTGKPFT